MRKLLLMLFICSFAYSQSVSIRTNRGWYKLGQSAVAGDSINVSANAAGGGGAPGGSTLEIQYNNAGAFAGMAKANVNTEGYPSLEQTAVGTNPTIRANEVVLFNRPKGGRNMLAVLGASGLDYVVQPFLGSNKICVWSHSGNSAAITAPTLFLQNFIHAAGNAEGLATLRNVATTSLFKTMKRLSYVTTGAINLSAGYRGLLLQHFIGNATTQGGFFYVVRFGFNSVGTGSRFFTGFSNTTGVMTITADPSATGTGSTAICVGVGMDAADANFQLFHRTANGNAVTKVNTGIAGKVADTPFEISMFNPPNSGAVYFTVQNLSTGATYSGSATTALPPANTLMSQRLWANTGSTTTVMALDIVSMYIETDN